MPPEHVRLSLDPDQLPSHRNELCEIAPTTIPAAPVAAESKPASYRNHQVIDANRDNSLGATDATAGRNQESRVIPLLGQGGVSLAR